MIVRHLVAAALFLMPAYLALQAVIAAVRYQDEVYAGFAVVYLLGGLLLAYLAESGRIDA